MIRFGASPNKPSASPNKVEALPSEDEQPESEGTGYARNKRWREQNPERYREAQRDLMRKRRKANG